MNGSWGNRTGLARKKLSRFKAGGGWPDSQPELACDDVDRFVLDFVILKRKAFALVDVKELARIVLVERPQMFVAPGFVSSCKQL